MFVEDISFVFSKEGLSIVQTFLLLDWKARFRSEREQAVLWREIHWMEVEMADIDSNSSCKRLRDENEELRQELSREVAMSSHFAAVCDRLRAERDDARAQLETAHADVDELLEFKSRMCQESLRRHMCPRITE